ncbi:MAG: tRNA preQ1(34) S-adenosylmethionine ribosyltransferase-isomerase QueA [Verrucomicrobia subdivision 3 bacterium]|nr:tRNA preQ1(34) S-adenosylmethionine ribosyltransferase-isomerase QueA [Limisphaerales bacterium]
MRTADFDYELPEKLIAQHPAPMRDASRLLVLNRATGSLTHTRFPTLVDYLRPDDVLVLNDSRVINARLRGANRKTGGEFEVLLLTENRNNDWWVLLRPGKRARVGTEIVLRNCAGQDTPVSAKVIDINEEGHRRLRFTGTANILLELDALGEAPLPPYIRRGKQEDTALDVERYQTLYAAADGSVAAPTAGLHFSENVLDRIRARGVEIRHVTLHVGLGTFAPVKVEHLERHVMHSERYHVPPQTAAAINAAKAEGRRVIAVGTTSVRVLESVAAKHKGKIVADGDETNIFIFPPFQFQIADALLTNFHLPHSTLLMLVSAFAAPGETRGRDMVLRAYAEAIRLRYRFFSYGDAMLIV